MLWGISTRVTDILRDAALLPLYRKAGLVHVSLGTEAQFIAGLENETRETIEGTYAMCRHWNPDMANWSMYPPWPSTDLFTELDDKVEIFDFEKYNFVTPIVKPDAMGRGELPDRVMHN